MNYHPFLLNNSLQKHLLALRNPQLSCPRSLNCRWLKMSHQKDFCLVDGSLEIIVWKTTFFHSRYNPFPLPPPWTSKSTSTQYCPGYHRFWLLYTNIPHANLNISCLSNYQINSLTTNFLITLIQFVLTRNYLSFQGIIYNQTSDIAMETQMAPFYASLFMGQLEQQKFFSIEAFNMVLILSSYYGPDFLSVFLQNLKTKFHVKFTWNHSPNKITLVLA